MPSLSIVFWVCLFLLAYTFFGYPLLIRLWAGLRPRFPVTRDFLPTVSVVIVAYNEAAGVARRLDNLLALDYPRDRLEILFVSDGSTDGTARRAWAYAERGVKTISFGIRRGKASVFNDVVPKLKGEIVVFGDVRQEFAADVLRILAGRFGDPQVGAVSGELILVDNPGGTSVGGGVGFYWRYEKFIRWNESRADSAVGATGALYAIRRDLFEPLPDDTLLDDVVIPMRIVRRGYRVLFEPAARAYDRVAATAREEWTRKVRTITGNFQLFARERWLLNPFCNRLWFQAVSHKGLRLLIPVFLPAALVANLLLADSLFYRWVLGGQLLFYAAAVGGYALRKARRRIPLLSVPCVICLLGWATVVAFLRFLAGRQPATWEKPSVVATDREIGARPLISSSKLRHW
ncbi:MAG: glycosyltransferase family 2 protein [Nitrospirae bacterium]|nr:glycosyltransferase family 2 protein [Nitrospirota bacterium]